jgi:hypothetical protein
VTFDSHNGLKQKEKLRTPLKSLNKKLRAASIESWVFFGLRVKFYRRKSVNMAREGGGFAACLKVGAH